MAEDEPQIHQPSRSSRTSRTVEAIRRISNDINSASGATKCMMIMMMIVHVFIFFAALALPIACIWIYSGNNFAVWMTSVTVVCALFVIISVIGCLGASRRTKCMLLTYLIFTLIIFIIAVVVMVLVFAFSDTIKKWDKDNKLEQMGKLSVAGQDWATTDSLKGFSVTIAITMFLGDVFSCSLYCLGQKME